MGTRSGTPERKASRIGAGSRCVPSRAQARSADPMTGTSSEASRGEPVRLDASRGSRSSAPDDLLEDLREPRPARVRRLNTWDQAESGPHAEAPRERREREPQVDAEAGQRSCPRRARRRQCAAKSSRAGELAGQRLVETMAVGRADDGSKQLADERAVERMPLEAWGHVVVAILEDGSDESFDPHRLDARDVGVEERDGPRPMRSAAAKRVRSAPPLPGSP